MNEIIERPHPALVHFPTGLYPSSFIFGMLFLIFHNPVFLQVSFWIFIIAAIMVLPVAATGFADMFRLKRQSPQGHHYLRIHLFNGALITTLSVVLGLLFFTHRPMVATSLIPGFVISTAIMTALVGLQGYIASLMVYRHHLGVEGDTR